MGSHLTRLPYSSCLCDPSVQSLICPSVSWRKFISPLAPGSEGKPVRAGVLRCWGRKSIDKWCPLKGHMESLWKNLDKAHCYLYFFFWLNPLVWISLWKQVQGETEPVALCKMFAEGQSPGPALSPCSYTNSRSVPFYPSHNVQQVREWTRMALNSSSEN